MIPLLKATSVQAILTAIRAARDAATTAATAAVTARDAAVPAAASATAAATSAQSARGDAVSASAAAVTAADAAVPAAASATASATSARLSSERARRTAERMAAGMGASGDARRTFGSGDDIWGTVTRLSEEVVGAAATADEQDGPRVIFEGTGTVVWEIDLTALAPGNPLADSTALAVLATTTAAAPELLNLSLTAEVLGREGETIRYVDGFASAVPGYPRQVIAAEGLALTSVLTEERGERLRLTLSGQVGTGSPPPVGGYTVVVALVEAPYYSASWIGTDPSKMPILAAVASRPATPAGLPGSGSGATQWIITSAGTTMLPPGSPNRTQVVIWHDAPSGSVVLVAPAGQTIRAAGSAATLAARGQRREALLYNDVWYVA